MLFLTSGDELRLIVWKQDQASQNVKVPDIRYLIFKHQTNYKKRIENFVTVLYLFLVIKNGKFNLRISQTNFSRTNNASETWNSRWNKQMNDHRQGLWRLITELRR